MTIHEKIRWARKERGWNIGFMRKQTGLSFERISEIEAGKPVKMNELVKIAEAVKRDISFFLSEDDPKDEILLWSDR